MIHTAPAMKNKLVTHFIPEHVQLISFEQTVTYANKQTCESHFILHI